ncbi:ABC transporter permease [Planctomycetota bacterium]|nr:ABC transporter permease [Planctomycetota bacterium]
MIWLLYAACAGFLTLFLIAPVAIAIGGVSLSNLAEIAQHPVLRDGVFNALGIASVTTVACLAIALPLAWIAARYRFAGRGVAEALLLAPLILPPFVGAIGFVQVLGRHGALNALLVGLGIVAPGQEIDWLGDHRLAAVVAIEALHLYPFLYLTTTAALARLDPALVEAARAAGAGPLTVWRRVLLPLLAPGLFAGASVVFVWSFTELGTPLMLGFDRHLAVQIFNGLAEVEKNRLPFAQVVVMLTLAALIYGIGQGIFGRRADALGKGASAPWPTVALRGWWAVAAASPFVVVIILAAAPHAAVALLSFSGEWYGTVLPRWFTTDHYAQALAHPHVVPGILNSLLYAGAATVLAGSLGAAIAWIAVRARPFGWQGLDLLAMLPLAVPGLIIAFGTLVLGVLLASVPVLGPIIDPRQNPTLLLICAYAVRRVPYVVRAVAAGLQQTPVALEEAAAACGAGPWLRLTRIVLPLIAASLAAGMLLTFSFSMLEVSDSLVIAQKRDFWPITRVLYSLTEILGNGPALACAFATWCMLFLACALWTASALTGRGAGRLLRD